MQVILKTGLTGTFQPSAPFMLVNGLAVVDFALGVPFGGAPAKVEWYFELTSDPPDTAEWFREVAEQDMGAGVFEMPPVVRNFSALPLGMATYDVQAARAHDFCRIQIRVASGVVDATVRTPFGLSAV